MRLTVLGGGGFRVPLIHQALLDDNGPAAGRVSELVLHDTSAQRLDAVGAVLAQQAARHPDAGRTAPAVRTTTSLDAALPGADFVFCAIRVGGLEGRVRDERIPLGEGVLGQETVGAGGVLFALRTLPVAEHIAERAARLAPRAWIINFTNPAGMVTEAMSRVYRRAGLGDRVIGICDSPAGLCRRAARALHLDPERAGYDYTGLNHLGWLRRLVVDGEDRLPRLLDDPAALETFEEGRLFGATWLGALGSLPNEYLHYYYNHRETLARLRRAGTTRGEYLHDQQTRFYQEVHSGRGAEAYALWESTLQEREATYMSAESPAPGDDTAREDAAQEDAAQGDAPEESGGYHHIALRLMHALHHDEATSLILNVPNGTTIPALDPRTVVETVCHVDADGPRPVATGPLTPHQLGLVLAHKAVEDATLEAARTGSRSAALRALAHHPLVDSVDTARRILAGHRAGPGG